MIIETKSIEDLKAASYNPRKSTEKQEANLRASLEKFGVVEPIIYNKKTDNIVGGHFRVREPNKLGIKEVECVIVDLSLEDEKELNIRLNANTGEWDLEVLQEKFEELDLEEWGLELEELEELGLPKAPQEDTYELPEEVKTSIKTGDLIEIGSHRLICGDSTREDVYKKLLNNKVANLYLSDPPYGVSYADKNKYLNMVGRGNRIQTNIENDHKTPEEMFKFWLSVFENAANSLNNTGSYYIFSPQGGDLLLLLQAVRDAGFQLKHVLIWAKNNHVLGRADYNYKHEPIVFGWKQKGTHTFYGKGDKLTSLWDYDKPNKNDLHPTMKPINVLSNAILNSTEVNDIILDNFLGSGSTMVAAHKLNRLCYGIEIDPKYCQVIIDRMITLDNNLIIKINGNLYKSTETSS